MTSEEAKAFVLKSCETCKKYYKQEEECRGSTECFFSKKMSLEALEKQIPKKPEYVKAIGSFVCSQCKMPALRQKFCSDCGQALDWSIENEK